MPDRNLSFVQSAGSKRDGRNVLLASAVSFVLFVVLRYLILPAFGRDEELAILGAIALVVVCAGFAFGPTRWLAHPDIAGTFAFDHPLMVRAILVAGTLVGIAILALLTV